MINTEVGPCDDYFVLVCSMLSEQRCLGTSGHDLPWEPPSMFGSDAAKVTYVPLTKGPFLRFPHWVRKCMEGECHVVVNFTQRTPPMRGKLVLLCCHP